jgi:hypothetical protein
VAEDFQDFQSWTWLCENAKQNSGGRVTDSNLKWKKQNKTWNLLPFLANSNLMSKQLLGFLLLAAKNMDTPKNIYIFFQVIHLNTLSGV